jgi:hypothetical protein
LRRPVLVSLALLALAALAAVAAAAPAAAPAAGGAGAIHPWGLQNEGGNKEVSREQAVRDALANDLLTAHVLPYHDDVAAMRRANPDLVILAYMNAVFAQVEDGGRYPDAWYARDVNGNRIQSRGTGNWMMDPTNEGWIGDRIAECKRRIAEARYDGCSLDMLGLASTSLGYVTGRPVNPRTGHEFTRAEWIDANAALAGRVSAAVSRLVYGNGLSMGDLYFGESTRKLALSLDGGVAEAWLRGSETPVTAFPSEERWLRDIAMMLDVQAMGKPMLTLTKLWVDATAAQRRQWREFALASYLLATDGTSYFFFSGSPTASRTKAHPWYSTRLGQPVEPYRNKDGVYMRNFKKGKVLVNPSGARRTVRFLRRYVDVRGDAVARTFTMAPHTGLVLRRG